jgi:hypothetical protein
MGYGLWAMGYGRTVSSVMESREDKAMISSLWQVAIKFHVRTAISQINHLYAVTWARMKPGD